MIWFLKRNSCLHNQLCTFECDVRLCYRYIFLKIIFNSISLNVAFFFIIINWSTVFFFAYETDIFDFIVSIVSILKTELIAKLITKLKSVSIIVIKAFVFVKSSIDKKDFDLMNFIERQYKWSNIVDQFNHDIKWFITCKSTDGHVSTRNYEFVMKKIVVLKIHN